MLKSDRKAMDSRGWRSRSTRRYPQQRGQGEELKRAQTQRQARAEGKEKKSRDSRAAAEPRLQSRGRAATPEPRQSRAPWALGVRRATILLVSSYRNSKKGGSSLPALCPPLCPFFARSLPARQGRARSARDHTRRRAGKNFR